MTKQKFYELCVLKTYCDALTNENSAFHKEAEMIGSKLNDDTSFNELVLFRSLAGLDPNTFPMKQPFDTAGSEYLLQVIVFAYTLEDDEFTDSLFKFLKSNVKLVDFSDEKVAGVLYSIFYDGIVGSYFKRKFSQRLGCFFLKNGKAAWELHGKITSLMYALGSTLDDMNLADLVKMKREHNDDR